jgi:uncharacterized protein (DUF4415 family)
MVSIMTIDNGRKVRMQWNIERHVRRRSWGASFSMPGAAGGYAPRGPPLGKEPRQLIAIRVDPRVLESFRKEARRRRIGYQTLINEVLAEHTRNDVA